MPQCCAVPFCSEKKGGHKFPRNKTVFKRWLLAIRRANFTPSTNALVCKKHFTPDDYMLPKESFSDNPRLRLKPEAVPSRFAWNDENGDGMEVKRKHAKTVEGACQLQKKCDTATLSSNTEAKQSEELFAFKETCEEIGMEDSNKDNPKQCFLCKHEVIKETSCNIFRIENLMDNPDIVQIYTGFDNYDHFMCIFNLFGDDINNLLKKNFPLFLPAHDALPPSNQFYLTLIKLRRNMCNKELSFHFGISISSVKKYLKSWINYLNCKFKDLNVQAPKETIEENLMFQEKAVSYTTIYCIEIKTKIPQTKVFHEAISTNNKSANALKLLVGISASGCVTLVSDAHSGSVSDIQLFEKCGIINQLQREDFILGDTECNVQDLDTHTDRQSKINSSECVNFKRVIGLGNTFKILSKLSSNLVPLGGKLIFVCFMLVILQKNIM